MYDRTARTGGRIVEEGDESAALFTPGYLFAGSDVQDPGDPGFAATIPQGNPVDTETPWVTAPPRATPAPIASSDPGDADSLWRNWTASGPQSITIALPNGADIRSLWVPVVTFPFLISLSIASGAPMYSVTTSGGEIIPIPKGCNALVLSAVNPNALRSDLWVYATADKFDPNKTGVNGPPLPISGVQSQYDKLITGTAGVKFYYPLSDAIGSLTVADFGPNKTAATPQGGVSLGGASLINDGASSAEFNGTTGTCIVPPVAVVPGLGGAAPWAVELWFNYAGLGQGGNAACILLEAGVGTAGGMRLGVLRANSHLSIGAFNADKGPQTFLSQGVHYIVAQWDGANGSYYIDGVQVYTSNNINDFGNWDSTKGLYVGGNPNANPDMDPIVGNIAKLAMYSRVLTAAEIATRWSNHA